MTSWMPVTESLQHVGASHIIIDDADADADNDDDEWGESLVMFPYEQLTAGTQISLAKSIISNSKAWATISFSTSSF